MAYYENLQKTINDANFEGFGNLWEVEEEGEGNEMEMSGSRGEEGEMRS